MGVVTDNYGNGDGNGNGIGYGFGFGEVLPKEAL